MMLASGRPQPTSSTVTPATALHPPVASCICRPEIVVAPSAWLRRAGQNFEPQADLHVLLQVAVEHEERRAASAPQLPLS
jgi:hypothetical protein